MRWRSGSVTVAVVALAVALSVGMSACSSGPRGVILSPRETDVAACADGSDRTVDQLAQVDCDLEGVAIVFPDGITMTAPEIGGGAGTQTAGPHGPGDNHALTNLGIYGVIAAESDPDGHRTRWWGTPEGIRKMQAAEGTE